MSRRLRTAVIGRGKVSATHARAHQRLPASEQQDEWRPVDGMTHCHQLQIEDFLNAAMEDREPLVNAGAGREVVELFTAVYRSARAHAVVRFPLNGEEPRGVSHATSH